jgi:hypothetical protein
VQVNIGIMRAFVRLRERLPTNADLARKLADLARKYDSQLKVVFDAIRRPRRPNLKSASTSKEDAIPVIHSTHFVARSELTTTRTDSLGIVTAPSTGR